MAYFQIATTVGAGGVLLNDLVGCSPCAIDTAPTCGTDGTHNVPDATLTCPTFSVTGKYYLQEYIDQLAGAEIPVKKVFTERRGILNFMMDLQSSMDTNGNMVDTAFFKDLGGISLKMAVDGTFYRRGEWYYEQQKFHITQQYLVAANTIQVGVETSPGVYQPTLGGTYEQLGRGSLVVGDTIRILRRDPADPTCCVEQLIKTIIAIDAVNNTITLEPTNGGGPSAYTFSLGDVIEPLRHGRNDCEVVEKEFGMIPPTSRVSYIHHLDNIIKFQKRELNTTYQAFSDVEAYVRQKLEHLNTQRVEQMGRIAYLGRNRRMSAAGQATKGETQGIITAIIEAQMRNPEKALISDFSSTNNDDDRVRLIYNELMKIQDSGWMKGGEPVIILMNRIASNQMSKMHRAWNNILGVTVNKTEITNKVFTYPIIETPTGIPMVNAYCEHLSHLYQNEGVMIMFPKSALSVHSRTNQKVVANGSNLSVQRAELTSKFLDVSLPNATECRTYSIMLEFSNFIMGTDSGAFRMIKGLNDC